MCRIILIEKSPFISSYLKENQFSITAFSSLDDALRKLGDYNPQLIILDGQIDENALLSFCKQVKNSLSVPILMVLNFYSSLDVNQFRNLGIDFIVKPFTEEELIKKIEVIIGKKQEPLSQQHSELIDKLRPYIRQEVKSEMRAILKQILEVM